jgi:two-component system chemotaxis response regulator CheY
MKRVMIVDDSLTMLMSLKNALSLAGFQVTTAADGAEAMSLLGSGPRPDLLITDINMPKMDGMQLIAAARKVLRFTPILVLTTESQQSRRDEAKSLGATGWLVKPVASEQLMKVIRQVLPGL